MCGLWVGIPGLAVWTMEFNLLCFLVLWVHWIEVYLLDVLLGYFRTGTQDQRGIGYPSGFLGIRSCEWTYVNFKLYLCYQIVIIWIFNDDITHEYICIYIYIYFRAFYKWYILLCILNHLLVYVYISIYTWYVMFFK